MGRTLRGLAAARFTILGRNQDGFIHTSERRWSLACEYLMGSGGPSSASSSTTAKAPSAPSTIATIPLDGQPPRGPTHGLNTKTKHDYCIKPQSCSRGGRGAQIRITREYHTTYSYVM